MSDRSRGVRLRALAKINLSLEVLEKRPDGYHNLRTVFQTISLADTIRLRIAPAAKTSVELVCALAIPDNLASRAAHLVIQEAKANYQIQIELTKAIPLGGGLGGGSSDAAAVLLALPVLCGVKIPFPRLIEIAAELGSDVPFFLLGGTALGLGRGTELYPLPDAPNAPALIVAPDLHVSTAEAYAALNRRLERLTSQDPFTKMKSSQSLSLCLGRGLSARDCAEACVNDFEGAVFERHPGLARLKRKLLKAGARPAMMTGSGAALAGIFQSREARERALPQFRTERVFKVDLVSRRRYQALWWSQLRDHIGEKLWPPQSRYAR